MMTAMPDLSLGSKVPVLDKGFVQFVGVMGSDAEIVSAARTSYSSASVRSEDEPLLRYLMRQEHWSPFEMAEMKFLVKAPLFVVRQWQRHRTGSYNEESGRYSSIANERYIPEQFHVQSKSNKQGRGAPISDDESALIREDVEVTTEDCFRLYNDLLADGCSREEARIVLPLNTYTTMVFKCDLRNLLHFLRLRMDSHAQYEIRAYAITISYFVSEHFPLTWRAFNDYVLSAKTLTRQEKLWLEQLIKRVSTHIPEGDSWFRMVKDVIETPMEGITPPTSREMDSFSAFAYSLID